MIWLSEEFYFSKLKKEDLPELLSFYLLEIYEHFNFTDYTQESFENELKYLLKEDNAFYQNSVYYVLRDTKDDKINGSIKTTYWDLKTPLPIEKLFNVNPDSLIKPNIENYWHIGRFVIARKILKDRISILKKMLFNAFYPIYILGSGLIIAECDKKVTTTLEKMEVQCFALGKSLEYICSETLPIYIKSEWLNTFFISNYSRYYTDANANDGDFFGHIAKTLANIEYRNSLPIVNHLEKYK